MKRKQLITKHDLKDCGLTRGRVYDDISDETMDWIAREASKSEGKKCGPVIAKILNATYASLQAHKFGGADDT